MIVLVPCPTLPSAVTGVFRERGTSPDRAVVAAAVITSSELRSGFARGVPVAAGVCEELRVGAPVLRAAG